MFFEEMDHSRHPQRCNTGKASYPQLSFDLMINIKGRLAQLCLLVYHFLNIRNQSGSVVCKYDSLFYSGKQPDFQFFFPVQPSSGWCRTVCNLMPLPPRKSCRSRTLSENLRNLSFCSFINFNHPIWYQIVPHDLASYTLLKLYIIIKTFVLLIL